MTLGMLQLNTHFRENIPRCVDRFSRKLIEQLLKQVNDFRLETEDAHTKEFLNGIDSVMLQLWDIHDKIPKTIADKEQQYSKRNS
jgi:hypothetical protein